MFPVQVHQNVSWSSLIFDKVTFIFHLPWDAKSYSPYASTECSNMRLFWGEKCELCSASVKRQDHPGLHWRRPFHHHTPNLPSALYPQKKCKIPLLFPLHPFSGACCFEISVWTVERKEKQESFILEGRKFILTESGEEHTRGLNSGLEKIANALSSNAYTDAKQSNKNEIVQLIKSSRPD